MAGVQAAHEQLPAGQWLMGGLFDDNYWGGGLPDMTWIDEVSVAAPPPSLCAEVEPQGEAAAPCFISCSQRYITHYYGNKCSLDTMRL